jgi:hypothetical protein
MFNIIMMMYTIYNFYKMYHHDDTIIAIHHHDDVYIYNFIYTSSWWCITFIKSITSYIIMMMYSYKNINHPRSSWRSLQQWTSSWWWFVRWTLSSMDSIMMLCSKSDRIPKRSLMTHRVSPLIVSRVGTEGNLPSRDTDILMDHRDQGSIMD